MLTSRGTDVKKAFTWYQKAADPKEGDKRDALAVISLAECYAEGIGTEKNLGEAEKLYKLVGAPDKSIKEDKTAQKKALKGLGKLGEYYQTHGDVSGNPQKVWEIARFVTKHAQIDGEEEFVYVSGSLGASVTIFSGTPSVQPGDLQFHNQKYRKSSSGNRKGGIN